MKCRADVALAVAGGYFLGRGKKIKLALILGSVAAGLRVRQPDHPVATSPMITGRDDTSRAESLADGLLNNPPPDQALLDDAGESGGREADPARQARTNEGDDVDGAEVSERVIFGLDGRKYRLDLTTENAAKLRDALAPFVAVARPRGRNSRSRRGRSGSRG